MVARAGRLGCGSCVIFLVQGQRLGGRAGRPGSGDRRLGWSGQLADKHQAAEHLIIADRAVKPQRPVSMVQGVKQAAHSKGGDRQRTARHHGIQAQVKLTLAGRQPLQDSCLQQLQLAIVVGRAEVLDILRTAAGGPHDLQAVTPDAVFTVRTYCTEPLYSPDLVHTFARRNKRTSRSASRPAFQAADRVTSQDKPSRSERRSSSERSLRARLFQG